MGDLYAAFTLDDYTQTGLTLGDMTVDYCKTMAGADVSQSGMTMTELGAGDYVLMSPNVTVRTVCRLHVTADSSKAALMVFDPLDGGIASFSTRSVYEAFSLGDDTQTGLTLGSFTVSYCKTLEGSAVSQSGMALTELGDGDYVLMNPNITERTVCRLYVTANLARSAALLFDPYDDLTGTSGTSVRQLIINALETRLQTILTANGYRTELGGNVFTWKQNRFQASELPGVDIRDMQEQTGHVAVGEHLHELAVDVRIASTTEAAVRQAIADVVTAVGIDLTFTALAQDTEIDADGTIDLDAGGDSSYYGSIIRLKIQYTTAPWSP